MTEQDTLFAPPPPVESRLTARQQLVLETVRVIPGGIPADEVGMALHRLRFAEHGGRACSCTLPEGEPCAWAETSGREVLVRLRELGYGLVRRRTGRWEIPGETPPPPSDRPPVRDDIPF